jgi:excisionase family DNA binding protein
MLEANRLPESTAHTLTQPRESLFDFDSGAAFLGTTPRHLRRLWQERRIGGCKIGRKVRFTEEDLRTFIADHHSEAIR